MSATLPADEVDRLATLRRLAVLDTPAEPVFDAIATLAARICGTPIALLAFIDEDRDWFKARVGVSISELPRDVSLCTHTILSRETFVVPDALLDPRFRENPIVTSEPRLRFYAGVPIRMGRGSAVGTLCVVDTKPRTLTPEQTTALEDLAALVTAQLELRLPRPERELLEEATRLNEELSALVAITDSALSTLDLAELIQVLLERLLRAMRADAGAILLDEGGRLVVRAMAGYGARAGDPPSLPAGAGVGGTIFETGQPLYVGDVRNDPRVLGPFLRDEGIASMLGVPLRSRGRLVGVLHVDWRQPHAGSASDLHLLETAAERCAAAIVNARLFAELRSTNEQLRALSARVQTVREEEAVRIAREIHDELGQLLTGLSLDIGWIRTRVARIASSETEPILARAEAVAELTDRTIRTVQRISEELRPAALDQLGLEAAIGVQLEGLAERSGIATSLGGTLGDRRLGDAIETGVFRIVQELLTNVARHSGATAVRVDLGLDGERGETLVVRVSDNGRGISPSDLASARSIGLVGLRERAILLGGTVDLGGEPGRGTEAVVRVPSGTRAP